jgi:hypothetical protein
LGSLVGEFYSLKKGFIFFNHLCKKGFVLCIYFKKEIVYALILVVKYKGNVLIMYCPESPKSNVSCIINHG